MVIRVLYMLSQSLLCLVSVVLISYFIIVDLLIYHVFFFSFQQFLSFYVNVLLIVRLLINYIFMFDLIKMIFFVKINYLLVSSF